MLRTCSHPSADRLRSPMARAAAPTPPLHRPANLRTDDPAGTCRWFERSSSARLSARPKRWKG